MAEYQGKWPSGREPISKIGPSDSCGKMEFPWRWDSSTISTVLDVIWGMPDEERKLLYLKCRRGKMKPLLLALAIIIGTFFSAHQSVGAESVSLSSSCKSAGAKHVILMHGGSVSRAKSSGTVKYAKRREKPVKEILKIGEEALGKGATALEVVAFVVSRMEDSGKLNAGRGAKPNKAGEKEMDASIMDGKTQKAGAVASVRKIKNPILGARYIMEKTENVLFVGPSADQLLKKAGLETASLTQSHELASDTVDMGNDDPVGTVGAVVLDKCGNLAAGTSTGGFDTKTPGRVGDSPIIGAGTFANETVAISATGHGEYFIRYAVAHDIYARMAYGGKSLKDAAGAVISELKSKGGKGGVIALDKDGNYATPHSYPGMVRGVAGAGIDLKVRTF